MDLENRLVVAKGEGEGNRMDWESGVNRCKLLPWEWISNEILLYSTGDLSGHLWWSMMEDNVRKRMYICMCDRVSLLYCRKLTEHCKPTIMEKIKKLKIFVSEPCFPKFLIDWGPGRNWQVETHWLTWVKTLQGLRNITVYTECHDVAPEFFFKKENFI